MPVDSTHPEYAAAVDFRSRIRDVLGGNDDVKGQRERYLRQPDGMVRPNQYEIYLERASFPDFSARTLKGLTGTIFRKPVSFENEAVGNFAKNMDGRGTSLNSLAKKITRETIAMNGYGVLVDADPNGVPVVRCYTAENITNWRETFINGVRTKILVVLKEDVPVAKSDDEFTTEIRHTFRVLRLRFLEGGPAYTSQIFIQTQVDNKEQFVALEEVIPSVRNLGAIDFVPFEYFDDDELSLGAKRPQFLGVVDKNLDIYRSDVDIAHGAHLTALPTPWIAGQSDMEEFPLGPWEAIKLNDPMGKVGLLEYVGRGLDSYMNLRDRQVVDLSVLGARFLEQQKRVQESAEGMRVRSRGDNSILGDIADNVSAGLSQVLNWMINWRSGEIKLDKPVSNSQLVTLNDDFHDDPSSFDEFLKLITGWKDGGYGLGAVYWNARKRELIPPDWTEEMFLEDRRKSLLTQQPNSETEPSRPSS